MKYYSHPGRLLIEHLEEVMDIGIKKIPYQLRDTYKITSLAHDFGKYTTYFQEYLFTKKENQLANHGFISAIWGAYIAIKEIGEDSYLPLIVYNSILHHHGNIQSLSRNLPDTFKDLKDTDYDITILKKIDIFKEQLKDMVTNKDNILKDMKTLGYEEHFMEFIGDENLIYETLAELKKIEFKHCFMIKDEELYFIHHSIYSALISSDKISASGVKYDKHLEGNFDELNRIRENNLMNQEQEINRIRTDIFNEIQKNLEKRNRDNNIFSITAPTGTGKTYSGFYAALRLKELLGLDGKIIYALPFTSIIEQNYDAISKIYEELENYKKNKSRYIIKHHNLSKTEYESEFQDYTRTQSELLIENWESGVIITTFVQLFETLVGSRNRMLKKYINFYDSVILLDEIQSIDIKYYKLVEFVLDKLCHMTNSKIIMMTATKPMILTQGVELLEKHRDYYDFFNRTKLIPKLDKISIEEFVDSFIDNLEDKSYLIVCNTIKQSLDIYDKFKDLGRNIYYLSTNILPVHRGEILKEISYRLENGENIILISTQVVEAGVDLDFDEVIRDIGPLDSIIQCAGRCNRSGFKDIGNVRIYRIVDDRGYGYGTRIYGNTTIEITYDLLKDRECIFEKDFYELIDEYFRQVLINKNQTESEEIIQSIKTLDFSEGEYSINKFSLIKDNPMYRDVLFIYDEIAEKAFEEYKEIIKLKSFQEKREKYLEIGQVLKEYTLSLPEKYCRAFTEEGGMLILPRIGIEEYYNKNTGFKRNDDEGTMIF